MKSVNSLTPKGTLYVAHFSSVPKVNNNQTIVVDYFKGTSQGSLTAYKGKKDLISLFELIISLPLGLSMSDTTSDPVLDISNNLLRCRADSILSFNVGSTAPNGAVFAMDIYPYSGGPSTQTILSIRDASTNNVAFVVELSGVTGEITLYRKDSGGTLTASPASLSLTPGDFHHLSL